MIAFFRRIRKGLLSSGQARKYLLYAIGEIALVVIGILIALQVNNSNEERKTLVVQEAYLKRLLVQNRGWYGLKDDADLCRSAKNSRIHHPRNPTI
jgi:hypothetical protein